MLLKVKHSQLEKLDWEENCKSVLQNNNSRYIGIALIMKSEQEYKFFRASTLRPFPAQVGGWENESREYGLFMFDPGGWEKGKEELQYLTAVKPYSSL